MTRPWGAGGDGLDGSEARSLHLRSSILNETVDRMAIIRHCAQSPHEERGSWDLWILLFLIWPLATIGSRSILWRTRFDIRSRFLNDCGLARTVAGLQAVVILDLK